MNMVMSLQCRRSLDHLDWCQFLPITQYCVTGKRAKLQLTL
jgi:hypothetical protein